MQKEDNYFRHNFILGLLHGVFYSFGMAFSNPETVIVTFLSLLGASKFFLGLAVSFIGSLGNLSGVLPQLYTTNFLETQKRKNPFWFWLLFCVHFAGGTGTFSFWLGEKQAAFSYYDFNYQYRNFFLSGRGSCGSFL